MRWFIGYLGWTSTLIGAMLIGVAIGIPTPVMAVVGLVMGLSLVYLANGMEDPPYRRRR